MCGKCWTRIVKLSEDVDIDSFSCGEPVIDTWFHRDALEYQEEGSCTVYVAVNDNNVIVGFFSLNMYYLQKRSTPDAIKAGITQGGNIPTVLLGRFGVSTLFRGEGFRSRGGVRQGPLLIREAILKAQSLAGDVGCRLMYVQALDDGLIGWYRNQGFTSMPNHPRNLVLDLHHYR